MLEAIDRAPLYFPANDKPGFCFAVQQGTGLNYLLANFYNCITLWQRTKIVPLEKETVMSWKTPKIVEVPVGMEINMYACAARK
jgi:coenzyme PQQ precursor peptide PqqA